MGDLDIIVLGIQYFIILSTRLFSSRKCGYHLLSVCNLELGDDLCPHHPLRDNAPVVKHITYDTHYRIKNSFNPVIAIPYAT